MSIVPLQGREFTERILMPTDEAKFEFLVFQGSPIDMVLRLMADGIEVQTPEGRFERFILNWPTRPSSSGVSTAFSTSWRDGGNVREYHVEKDARTGEAGPNPPLALAIEITDSVPPPGLPYAQYRGRYYAVADTPWDRKGFRLLSQIFQMTVTDVSQMGLPVTISK